MVLCYYFLVHVVTLIGLVCCSIGLLLLLLFNNMNHERKKQIMGGEPPPPTPATKRQRVLIQIKEEGKKFIGETVNFENSQCDMPPPQPPHMGVKKVRVPPPLMVKRLYAPKEF